MSPFFLQTFHEKQMNNSTKNICELLSRNGTAVSIATAYDYTPFGAVTASNSSIPNTFCFSSEVLDPETSLIYYNYRHDKPIDGRGINRDPIGENGGLNLYCFIFNALIFYIDVIALRPQSSSSPASNEARKSKEKIKKEYEKNIDSFIAKYNTPVDCKTEKECTLITFIVEMGDPSYDNYIERKIGHTGIAVGQEYYDFGPSVPITLENTSVPGIQWFDNPAKHNLLPTEDVKLRHIINSIGKLASDITIQVEFCSCESRKNNITNYWQTLYENIKNGKNSTWSLFGLQCTSAVAQSFYGNGKIDKDNYRLLSPELFLKKNLSDLKNDCGNRKGKSVYMKKIRGY